MAGCFCGELVGVQDVSAIHRLVLAVVPVRQGAGWTHIGDFCDNRRGTAVDGDSGWRNRGDVVCRGGWIVHFDWLVKHIFARAGRNRRLQKPGFITAGDGDSRRRKFTYYEE